MAAVTHPLKRLISEYGNPVLLALLVHALLAAMLVSIKFRAPVQLPLSEPITSFLYQPPPPGQPVVTEQAPEQDKPDRATARESKVTDNTGTASPQTALSEMVPEVIVPSQHSVSVSRDRSLTSNSLTQRALNQVAKPDPAVIDRAVTASYQQFLQKQQQPRLTVDKKHWPISQDPKAQVVAQLDDGRQIIRTREGCRIGDPMLDGFAALMAAKPVPCGDEISTSELLKQALDKHIKR